jgi:hypothetical protein
MYRATPDSLMTNPVYQQAEILRHDLNDSSQSVENAKRDCLGKTQETCERTLLQLETQIKRASSELSAILDPHSAEKAQNQ